MMHGAGLTQDLSLLPSPPVGVFPLSSTNETTLLSLPGETMPVGGVIACQFSGVLWVEAESDVRYYLLIKMFFHFKTQVGDHSATQCRGTTSFHRHHATRDDTKHYTMTLFKMAMEIMIRELDQDS